MECLLCNLWARMPYALRPTTPTTAQETEGALIVGYWIASRATTVPRICERHMNILQVIDRQEERRIEIEKAAAEETQQLQAYHQQTAHLHERQQSIFEAARAEVEIVPSFVPAVAPIQIQVQPQTSSEFKLGPGPLSNENIVTQPPALPVQADPAQIYRKSTLKEPAKPGTIEGALEAAMMPPTEGAKTSHPCTLCGKEVVTGDVHMCDA